MNHSHPLLIVDDDPEERYMMQMALTDIGWGESVLLFQSAEALLHHLTLLQPEQYPSLLLLDYHMPGIDGAQLLEMLKESRSFQYLPIIVYSTHLTDALQEKLLQKGALKCYSKMQSYREAVAFAQLLKQTCLTCLQDH